MPQRDGYAQGSPCWVDIAIDDIEGAKAFYGGLFGWTWEDQYMPDGSFMYSLAQMNGLNVAGLGAAPPEMIEAGVRSAWHVYLAADSADAAYQAALDAGGAGVFGPFDVMGSGRIAFVTDDQGIHIGIWQAGTHKGAQLIHEPGTITWTETYAPDPAAAKRFYGAVFGLTTQPADMGEMSYDLWKVGDDVVGGLMAPPEQVPPCWSVYFGTADAEQTAARATELGGTVGMGPFPTPLGPLVVLHDPSGGVFMAVERTYWPDR